MKKLLLLEDDSEIRELIAEIFETNSYEVKKAKNGKEGISILNKYSPDIILCDIMMPEMDGLEFKQHLSGTKHVGIPFIYLTAHSELVDFRKAMELGADDYITKPIRAKELLKIVNMRLSRIDQLSQEKEQTVGNEADKLAHTNKVLLKLNNEHLLTDVSQIVMITAEGDYSNISLASGKNVLLKKSMNSWLKSLPSDKFIRVHRQTILNLDFIEKIETWSKGALIAKVKNISKPVEFSHRYSAIIKKNMLIK